ncbi:hypothetical protein NEMIN01_1369 [Nematocida minor]|uniref:uncharacterized protein n=1 Tax=Nematocida minor TaxID=1912983 RepID=UPI00221FF999|nr:uncharacterized protein NEMIN01_1369 [Nematocida minor]KAI5191100.1 hypothetical protein NEMIN01_1369 [Nematocida minor]
MNSNLAHTVGEKDTSVSHKFKKYFGSIKNRTKGMHRSAKAAIRYPFKKLSAIVKMCSTNQSVYTEEPKEEVALVLIPVRDKPATTAGGESGPETPQKLAACSEKAKEKALNLSGKSIKILEDAELFVKKVENILQKAAHMRNVSYAPILLLFYLKQEKYKISSELELAEMIFHTSEEDVLDGKSDLHDEVIEYLVAEGLEPTICMSYWLSFQRSLEEAYTSLYRTVLDTLLSTDKCSTKTKKNLVFYNALLKQVRDIFSFKLAELEKIQSYEPSESEVFSELVERFLQSKKVEEFLRVNEENEISGDEREDGEEEEYASNYTQEDTQEAQQETEQKAEYEIDDEINVEAAQNAENNINAEAECEISDEAQQDIEQEAVYSSEGYQSSEDIDEYDGRVYDHVLHVYADDEVVCNNDLPDTAAIMNNLMTSPLFKKQREKNIQEGNIEERDISSCSPEELRGIDACINYIRHVGVPTPIARGINFDEP